MITELTRHLRHLTTGDRLFLPVTNYSSLRNLANFLPLISSTDQSRVSPGASFKLLTMSSGIVARKEVVFTLARITVDLLTNTANRMPYLISLLRLLCRCAYGMKNLLMAKTCSFGQNKAYRLK